jgi:hypothetical protein
MRDARCAMRDAAHERFALSPKTTCAFAFECTMSRACVMLDARCSMHSILIALPTFKIPQTDT